MDDKTIFSALNNNDPSILGAIIPKNKVVERIVAYHKQIERRMDGSSGGVCGAIIETLVREGYYFSGAKFDDNLHLKHIVSNEPEKISTIAGYKPVESDCSEAFLKIREIIESGEKVVFCGTSLQCYALQQYVGITGNLVTIEIINTDFISGNLLLKYVEELSLKYGSKVVDIRFYNKEFAADNSKRITLENGRVYFTNNEDAFDKLVQCGRFTKKTNNEVFSSLDARVADFTVGAYKMDKSQDEGLGYAYISFNSDSACALLNKVKKRLVVVKEGNDVQISNIRYRKFNSVESIDDSILQNNALSNLVSLPKIGRFHKTRKVVGAVIRGFEFAQFNPRACYQFIKFNFFTKNIKTDLDHNGFVFISPHCVFKLVEGYQIILKGALSIGPRRIKNSRLETRLRMEAGAKLIVYESCSFGAGSNVEIYRNAVLEVGDLRSNAELNIICGEHITLGSPNNIARNATIRDTSGHLIATPGYKMTKPITIGNHVWICTESTVMPGVTIGDGSVVGACSFVNKKVPAFTMVQGTPAEVICPIKYFRI